MLKLDEYRKKRDRERGVEPPGIEPADAAPAPPTWEGAYVVHLHDATRLHHDLRFEAGGVLASFAVPRGPSLDPKERRLAVRTEDHPIEYLDFEGVIPTGQYGAGAMILWDRGRIRFQGVSAEEGLARGKLDIELEGQKLHGEYALVRTRGGRPREPGGEPSEWLLIKRSDRFAAPGRDLLAEAPRSVLSGLTVEELAGAARVAGELEEQAAALGAPALGGAPLGRIRPMLCAPEGAPLAGDDWLYELKLDGVRIVAAKTDREVTLTGRSLRDMTATYPEVARAAQALAARRAVLDGEVVAFDESGRPSFQRLGGRIHLQRELDIRRAMVEIPVLYVAFDLLALGDRDLRPLPLIVRKALLARLIPGPGVIRALDFVEGDGGPLLSFCRERRLEGAVAKRKLSPYREGPGRGGDWVKMKCEREDDFVVVGWTQGERGRARMGALDLATYDGDRLLYRGKVGSGFEEQAIDAVLSRLAPLATEEKAAVGQYVPAPRGRTHVRPEVVASIRYAGFSADGQVLHAVFRGLRDDVAPRECTAGPPATRLAELDLEALEPPARPERRVAITNRDKVLWPDDGLTKGDLCGYYEVIAPALLPYLKDRPALMQRFPDGIRGKSFFQWSVPVGAPSWLRTARIQPVEGGDEMDVVLIDDVESLLYIANLATIPIHILAGRAPDLEHADFLTIDLDVKLASLAAAVDLAQTLRGLLEQIGLAGFPKTSGKSGLHVLVPLGPGVPHRSARALADLLGRLLVQGHPDTATMERLIAKRGPRVYVDTGQTGRSRAIVAPYSLRAEPGGRVSTPLRWDEVEPGLDPARFTLRAVPERVVAAGDPMAGLLTARPSLPEALERLEALVPRAR